ncbi:3-hydroxyisobutyrate dehydrogenase [Halioxenophilus sp. WMMB6]|uniref:3-hydroxyisobutyrate dehydrogenase n=1 Tax=Halioxenophilus sp. WMMB6 TaxID=3073815 RepID=UPI00295E855E|nr:3-hydroxyisobutyrate dehydrogenase [Halioxenophilus sp. WMMB6]
MNNKTVAFIGLGNMGGPMAVNLAKAGFTVNAFDLSPAALDAAKSGGCEPFTDSSAAAKSADYVVTMLPNGQIVEAVYLGENGLLSVVKPDALVIDCSTVAPENSKKVGEAAEAKGIAFIDAPVSGGTAAAGAGTLSFMCGGSSENVERAKAVLDVMGANIFHAGAVGAGAVAKICNNMLLAIHMIGTSEAIQMGVKNGLDPKVLSDIMLKSSGGNWSLEKYNPYPGVMETVPASRNYEGGFFVDLMLKDLNLAVDAAKASSATIPLGGLARNLYSLFREGDAANGRKDFSSIVKMFGQIPE